MTQTMAGALRRDRLFILLGIVTLSLLSWVYLVTPQLRTSSPPASTDAQAGTAMAMGSTMLPWSADLLILSTIMWSVMMVAMMLPTATPMILAFARLRRQRGGQSVTKPVWLFVSGYLVVWMLFAIMVATAQWTLHGLGLLTSAMGSATALPAAVLLVATGLFQWSSLKEACLSKCRSPLDFLLNEWRQGGTGGFVMGLHHGAFCVGCCWLLMLLMFVGGVMNLIWMAAIAVFVLTEKILPPWRALRHLSGSLLILAGACLLAMAAPASAISGGLSP